jgi:tetratricopeptide (TPR) repeat protein
MSFILKLFGLKKVSAEDIYLKGMDAYTAKNFTNALRYFDLAYKKSKLFSTRVNALTNSATINENRGNHKESSEFFYKAALLKAENKNSNAEIIELLTRSYRQRVKVDKKNMGQVAAPLMLYAIAEQDFNLSQKGYNRIKDLPADPLIKLAIKAWDLAKDRDTAILESENEDLLKIPGSFPKEMTYVVNDALSVIKAYSVVESSIALASPDRIRAGDETTLKLTILSHANVEITKMILNVGNKGIISNFPREKETFKLGRNQSEMIDIILEGQLNGKWEIGPVEVTYSSSKYNFTVKSNVVQVIVIEGTPSLKLEMEVAEVIEEDFEYEISSRLTNIGKVIIENIQIKLVLPSEEIAKFTEGSAQKTIFSLNPGESFEFSNKINFQAGLLGKEYLLKLLATYKSGESSQELKLSGKPEGD